MWDLLILKAQQFRITVISVCTSFKISFPSKHEEMWKSVNSICSITVPNVQNLHILVIVWILSYYFQGLKHFLNEFVCFSKHLVRVIYWQLCISIIEMFSSSLQNQRTLYNKTLSLKIHKYVMKSIVILTEKLPNFEMVGETC